MLCIPVRYRGEVIGVLTRESAPSFGRQPGELERTYVDIFNRFARMIAAGDFPFDAEDVETEEAPRVGDGVILLDASGRVEYTSPNAVSALHRLGSTPTPRACAWRAGPRGHAGAHRLRHRRAGHRGDRPGVDVTVLIRCIPLLEHGAVTGAVVLLRDISELRRRDLLLLSKDATIREIHHRVKNNLQTISSLLRLQGRRLASEEAKAAIEESVRRIRSIALVHEILSREAGDDVPFVEIVRPLVRMVRGGHGLPGRPDPWSTSRATAGRCRPTIATPLAVVLNELLQNAVDHAYPRPRPDGPPGRGAGGDGERRRRLRVRVVDDGVGLPDGFDSRPATGLGLSIVRRWSPPSWRRDHDHPRRGATHGDGRPTVDMPRPATPGPTTRVGARCLRERLAEVQARLGWPRCPGSQEGRAGQARAGGRPTGGGAATLLLGGAAPDARVLVGDQGVLEARAWTSHSRQTALAVSICSMAGPVVPTGEEEVGIGVTTARRASRLVRWSGRAAALRQGHGTSTADRSGRL